MIILPYHYLLIVLFIAIVRRTDAERWVVDGSTLFAGSKWGGGVAGLGACSDSTSIFGWTVGRYWTPPNSKCGMYVTIPSSSFGKRNQGVVVQNATALELSFSLIDVGSSSVRSSLVVTANSPTDNSTWNFTVASPQYWLGFAQTTVVCTIPIPDAATVLTFTAIPNGAWSGVYYVPIIKGIFGEGSANSTMCSSTVVPPKSRSVSQTAAGTATQTSSEESSFVRSTSVSTTPLSSHSVESITTQLSRTLSGTIVSSASGSHSVTDISEYSSHTSTSSASKNNHSITTSPSRSTTRSPTPTCTLIVSHDSRSASRTTTQTASQSSTSTSTIALPPIVSVETVVVGLASQAVITSAVTAAAFIGASAAGGAVMQAALSAAACAKDDDAGDEAPGMSMYIVSPFVGNDYGMVYGNMALVVVCCLLHVGAAMIVRRIPHFAASNTRAAMATVRFPHVTLLFAGLAVQGVLLGGWQALWVVVRNEADGGGEIVAMLVTFLVSHMFVIALIYLLVTIRSILMLPLSPSSVNPYRIRVDGRSSLQHADVPLGLNVDDGENVQIGCNSRPVLSSTTTLLGPIIVWFPQTYRRMYGVAFNDYHPRSVTNWCWTAASIGGLPWITAAASSARPSFTSSSLLGRDEVCNGILFAAVAVFVVYMGCILWFAPFRVRVKNPLTALQVLLLALTCLLTAPAVRGGFAASDGQTLRAVVGILQSLTTLAVIGSDLWAYHSIDRHVMYPSHDNGGAFTDNIGDTDEGCGDGNWDGGGEGTLLAMMATDSTTTVNATSYLPSLEKDSDYVPANPFLQTDVTDDNFFLQEHSSDIEVIEEDGSLANHHFPLSIDQSGAAADQELLTLYQGWTLNTNVASR